MSNLTSHYSIVSLRVQDLPVYAQLSIAFEVRTRFEVIGNTLEELQLIEKRGEPPWMKDYDQIEHPLSWPKRWSLENWDILGAYQESQLRGGCIVARNTDGVELLEGREDLAVLWDLRIDPEHRRLGLGSLLFQAAVNAARVNGCRELRVETQNINVPACRLYEAKGCRLCNFNRNAYRDYPNEVQLIWRKVLSGDATIT